MMVGVKNELVMISVLPLGSAFCVPGEEEALAQETDAEFPCDLAQVVVKCRQWQTPTNGQIEVDGVVAG